MDIGSAVVIFFLCLPGLAAIIIYLRARRMVRRELSKLRKGRTP